METQNPPAQLSWNWFEIWWQAFSRPTIATFARIASHPKASIKWGLLWVAFASWVTWDVGPQRGLISGLIADNFGVDYYHISIIGAPISILLGVIGLMIWAALAHGMARWFKGSGSFRQLFFCWAVMQLPFILLIGLVFYLPTPAIRSPGEVMISRAWIAVQWIKMIVAAILLLYMLYAQVVAFGAVEGFGFWKGFGVLILLSIVVGIAGGCLSVGLQALMNKLMYPYYYY